MVNLKEMPKDLKEDSFKNTKYYLIDLEKQIKP